MKASTEFGDLFGEFSESHVVGIECFLHEGNGSRDVRKLTLGVRVVGANECTHVGFNCLFQRIALVDDRGSNIGVEGFQDVVEFGATYRMVIGGVSGGGWWSGALTPCVGVGGGWG